MKINILGASGALGRQTVIELMNRGVPPQDLVLSVRSPEKVMDFAKDGITVRRADYENRESLLQAFRSCEILHLIPTTAPVEQRIMQHANAVAAAEAAGIRKISFSSISSAAVPESRFNISPFLLYAEKKLRLSSLEWTILRNNLYLDPVADWIPELKSAGYLPYPMKRARIAYITREDLARATAGMLLGSGHQGRVYDLTGPEALSMPELAEAASSAAGSRIEFRSISENEFARVCRQGADAVPEGIITALTTLYRAAEAGEFATLTDHVERLSGRTPERAESFLVRCCRTVG